jgi:DeoR/GlpR family transcriptional regulator of sugar metabolism
MIKLSKNVERLNNILKLLYEKKKIEISELCNILSVSQNTIYRDLKSLEKENKLIRVKKGAVNFEIDSPYIEEYPLYYRLRENCKAKLKIAETAAVLINNNETIFIDGSTSCVYLAKTITKKNSIILTVITPSPIVCVELLKNNNITVLLLGGIVNKDNFCSYSDFNAHIFENLNIKHAFFGCSGFSLKRGFTEAIENDYKFKKFILNIADHITILADHSKYNITSTFGLGEITIADSLVTDANLSPEDINTLKAKGLKLFLVK